MKNIEFYYDELLKQENVYKFCLDNGAKLTDGNYMQDIIVWLNEEHQILDKQEKRYLSNIVKPFRNKVKYIKKITIGEYGFIEIVVKNEFTIEDSIDLPSFGLNTMYKGMESGKRYTLKKLGL